MADGVRVQGLRRAVRDLEKLGVDISDLKGAFSALSQQAAGYAKQFAPHRTGRLAASVRGNKAKNKAVVIAGGARAPYAGPINYGWAARNIAPQRFMQRADQAIKPDVLKVIDRELDRAIARRGLS